MEKKEKPSIKTIASWTKEQKHAFIWFAVIMFW